MADLEHTKRVALSFYKALEDKDPVALDRVLAPDAELWVIGSTPASGSCDKPRFMELFAHMRATIDGPMKFVFDAVTAEDDRVAIMARGQMRTVDGKDYNNTYHFFVRVRGDQVVEMREYMDTELLRKVFT